jgi:DNA-binding transcriptional MerR regulator
MSGLANLQQPAGDFMAKGNAGSAAAGDGQKHMTLTEVAKRSGLSMPTLQKYKQRYGDRIPSVGKGRKQRYPEESLPVFAQLREENMARRGRPRKDAAATPARRRGRPRKTGSGAAATNGRRRGRPRKAASGGGEKLLTLTQVGEQTRISYPTLLRYVKSSLARIPHVGAGRRRRFKPEAVSVFQQLRGESRRGRPPGSKTGSKTKTGARRGRPPGSKTKTGARRGRPPGTATGARRGRPPGIANAAAGAAVTRLSSLLKRLERRLAAVERELKKPLRVVRR